MLGETVTVWRKSQTGTDCMGEPAFSWEAEEVCNCLVRPLSGGDLADALRPDGVRAAYEIAFPKDYEGRGDLRGCKVTFRDMDEGQALLISGSPGITRPCPTEWDTTAEAGRTDG